MASLFPYDRQASSTQKPICLGQTSRAGWSLCYSCNKTSNLPLINFVVQMYGARTAAGRLRSLRCDPAMHHSHVYMYHAPCFMRSCGNTIKWLPTLNLNLVALKISAIISHPLLPEYPRRSKLQNQSTNSRISLKSCSKSTFALSHLSYSVTPSKRVVAGTICLEKSYPLRLLREGKSCPLCNEPNFVVTDDKYFKRKTNELKVRGPHKRHGCEWMGELGNLDLHSNSCPKRPWQCKLCDFGGTYDVGTSDHLANCTKLHG